MSTTYQPATFTGGQYTAIQLTAEFEKIRVSLAETLARVSTVDNSMEENLNLNSHQIINAAAGTLDSSLVTLLQMNTAITAALGSGGTFDHTQILADIVTNANAIAAEVTSRQALAVNSRPKPIRCSR